MDKFIINGGNELSGIIEVKGAKNEAFQVLIAALLTEETVKIYNVPNIADVDTIIKILKILGVTLKKNKSNSYEITAKNIFIEAFNSSEFQKYAGTIRGSLMLIGALISRIKLLRIPKPGGDKIGRRPLDVHFNGLEKLGVQVDFDSKKESYIINAKKVVGASILLDEASVTGTANIIMASVLAKGKTVIHNAASEPYISQLCILLNKMGAKIKGYGSNVIEINGVEKLHGAEHEILPDIIEVGTFIGLAAATKSHLKIKNVPSMHILPIINGFRKLGIELELLNNMIEVPKQKYKIHNRLSNSIVTLQDSPWPGFPPDLISVAIVCAINAYGTILIRQRMFESRLFFVDNLIEMGAQAILCDPHRVVVIGLNGSAKLKGIKMNSPDIRAGLALVIASLSAEGTSIVENIAQIDRGYEDIENRLISIGADIKRIPF